MIWYYLNTLLDNDVGNPADGNSNPDGSGTIPLLYSNGDTIISDVQTIGTATIPAGTVLVQITSSTVNQNAAGAGNYPANFNWQTFGGNTVQSGAGFGGTFQFSAASDTLNSGISFGSTMAIDPGLSINLTSAGITAVVGPVSLSAGSTYIGPVPSSGGGIINSDTAPTAGQIVFGQTVLGVSGNQHIAPASDVLSPTPTGTTPGTLTLPPDGSECLNTITPFGVVGALISGTWARPNNATTDTLAKPYVDSTVTFGADDAVQGTDIAGALPANEVKDGTAYGIGGAQTGTYSGGGGGSGEPMIPIASATISVAAGVVPTKIQDVSTSDNKVSTLSLQVTAPSTASVSLALAVRVAAGGEIIPSNSSSLNGTVNFAQYLFNGTYPVAPGTTSIFTGIPVFNAIDSIVLYATTTSASTQSVVSSGSLA